MLFQFRPQVSAWRRRGGGAGHDDNIPAAKIALMTAEAFPHDALDAVAIYRGGGGLSRNGQTQTGPTQVVGRDQYGECPTREAFGVAENAPELNGSGQARRARKTGLARNQDEVDYTLNRARPLARRAFRTRRPFLVRIRARKPWVRLRCRLLGWNVLFMTVTRFADGRSARTWAGQRTRNVSGWAEEVSTKDCYAPCG